MSSKLGANEAQTELYTSLDLRSCHLLGNPKERRFLASVFHRMCLPKVELLLSR